VVGKIDAGKQTFEGKWKIWKTWETLASTEGQGTVYMRNVNLSEQQVEQNTNYLYKRAGLMLTAAVT